MHGPYTPPRGEDRNEGMNERDNERAPLSTVHGEAIMGAEVQGHPGRAQPYEGSGNRPSLGLYGRSGATN